jgi:hypothetical protein
VRNSHPPHSSLKGGGGFSIGIKSLQTESSYRKKLEKLPENGFLP